ncbi:MAG TPA: helix-turn-helix domain-containing protein [Pirellulales bacterium]|jgi:hypothetical protein
MHGELPNLRDPLSAEIIRRLFEVDGHWCPIDREKSTATQEDAEGLLRLAGLFEEKWRADVELPGSGVVRLVWRMTGAHPEDSDGERAADPIEFQTAAFVRFLERSLPTAWLEHRLEYGQAMQIAVRRTSEGDRCYSEIKNSGVPAAIHAISFIRMQGILTFRAPVKLEFNGQYEFIAPKQQQSPPRADGPDSNPDGIWWGGAFFLITGKRFDLLKAIWNAERGVPFSQLGAEIWGDELKEASTIRSLVSRLSTTFAENGIALQISTTREVVNLIRQ